MNLNELSIQAMYLHLHLNTLRKYLQMQILSNTFQILWIKLFYGHRPEIQLNTLGLDLILHIDCTVQWGSHMFVHHGWGCTH